MTNIHKLAGLRSILSREEFIRDLGAFAVLVRLDERGGRDEPAPWAFHGGDRPLSELMNEADTISSEESDDDVAIQGAVPKKSAFGGKDDDVTLTSGAPPLAIPPARGQASVHLAKLPPGKVQGDIVVGRADACDVVIPERSVSKRHAKLVVKEGPLAAGAGGVAPKTFTIIDVGSSNGVAVNGRRAKTGEPMPLHSGDVVELGDIVVLFLDAPGFYEHLPKMAG